KARARASSERPRPPRGGPRTRRRSRSLLARAERVDEIAECAAHPVEPLAVVEPAHLRPGDDDVVGLGGQALGLGPKRLAEDALDARALDGTAHPSRDRQAEARAFVV